MVKKILSLVLVIAITASIAVTGTMAYLTSQDDDVNVMTLGSVKIDQIEQEWNEDKTELVDFTQAKPLFPYVGELGWENKDEDDGAYRRFTMNNVVDKYVSVKNTGKSDAYVRTFIALEMGSFTYEEFKMIGASVNSAAGREFPGMNWMWTDDFEAEIDGHNYNVMVAVYDKALKPGETTIPSLLQVYLDKTATNEDVEKLDGNGNGTYDILAYSQAVQTAGFEPPVAATLAAEENYGPVYALNTAFGDTAGEYHPWADGVAIPVVVSKATAAYDSTRESGAFILGKDINTSDSEKHYSGNREYAVRDGVDYTINLNGHTINHNGTYQDGKNTGYTYLFTTAYNGKLTVNGEGAIKSENTEGFACIIYAQGPSEAVINSGDFTVNNGVAVWAGNDSKVTINGGSFVSTGPNQELIYSSGGIIDIYGGFFHNTGWENRPVNVANANRGTGFINIYGGTFVNFDPSTGGDDTNNIKVMDGYKVVSETQANGDIWYAVVPQ